MTDPKTSETQAGVEVDTTGLLASSLHTVHHLEMERWFLLGVVYALLIAFLIVVTRSEY